MNHNLLCRRQLLFYLGLGVVGIGAATTFSNFRKVNAPSISPAKSNNTQDSETITVKTPAVKSLPEFQGISQWLNSTPLSIAYGGRVLSQRILNLRSHSAALQRIGGVAIAATAIAILLGWDVQIQLWLAPFFPTQPL